MRIAVQRGVRTAMNCAWALAAGLILIDCVWLPLARFHASPAPLLRDASIFAALCLLWGVYARLRPDVRLAALIETAAFLVVFTLALELLSYFSTALSLPLCDAAFAAADHALGFDFPEHLAFVAERPRLAHVLEFAYNTSMLQIAITVVALSATRRIGRLRSYAALFAFTATIVIVTAAIFPSLGPYAYFHIQDSALPAFSNPRTGWQSVPHVLALRDGTMRTLPLDDLRGLVSFPSFHTALALITVWAILPVRMLAVPFFIVNALLIFGAPSNGDHYLCDLIGGAAIAFLGLRVVTGGSKPRLALAPAPLPAE